MTVFSTHGLIPDLAPSHAMQFGLVRQDEVLFERFHVSLHLLLQNKSVDEYLLIGFILFLVHISQLKFQTVAYELRRLLEVRVHREILQHFPLVSLDFSLVRKDRVFLYFIRVASQVF